MAVIILHFNHSAATEEESINVMIPMRQDSDARKKFFQEMLLAGRYTPAYAVNSDDKGVAFDVGNDYPHKDVTWVRFPGAERSTSVGDIIQQQDGKWMLIMGMGFEEI